MIPEQRVFSKPLHQVGLPAHLAVEIDGRKRTTLEEDEHGIPVGHG